MTDNDLIECLLCGERCRSLGIHARKRHGIGAAEYRERCGLRHDTPLVSPATRARYAAAISATIAAGRLDAHYAGNAQRGAAAGASGRIRKRALIGQGVTFRLSVSRTPDAVIDAIVVVIEAGTTVAAAIRSGSIGATAFYAALKRDPEYNRRVKAAIAARRGVPGEVVSREDARARGMTRYWTGETCRSGHTAQRNVSSGECVTCRQAWAKQIPAAATNLQPAASPDKSRTTDPAT